MVMIGERTSPSQSSCTGGTAFTQQESGGGGGSASRHPAGEGESAFQQRVAGDRIESD